MSRRDFFEQEKRKKIITTFIVGVGLAVVAFVTVFVMYSQKQNNEAEANLLALTENQENIVSNDDFQATSYTQDKGVENLANITANTAQNTVQNIVKASEENKVAQNTVRSPEEKEPVAAAVKNEVSEEKTEEKENVQEENIAEEELKFQAPVVGDIIKDFAMETLVYSETLDEWCTHSGIDIKANKADVVVASEKGKVENIKNDPRYGLTIIISHNNGFKTVYSNLLTTEFVQEGEEVEKGQTIATVGETASFEVADETHLHFEMYKDGVVVNPTIYLK